MASAADGYSGAEEHLQQQNMMYHVPQQSRREKLRFPTEETSFLLLHHPNTAPPLHNTNTLTTFLPSSSSSYYYSQNPNFSFIQTSQFIGNDNNALHLPTQIPHQPFSLSLSSLSSTPPPSRHQLTDRVEFNHPAQLGPFTGYAAVLNRSRFLEPARQLLEEICDVCRGGGVAHCADPSEPLSVDHAMEDLTAGCGGAMEGRISGLEEQQWKKTRLIYMLDEVYRRYRHYYQQMQAVITSFESVMGLSAAAPYASMALGVMSKHFKCLKNTISDQLHHINKALKKEGINKEESFGFGLINSGVSPHRTANNLGSVRQPNVWRPQRGLPERAVAVLRAWLFEHFLHPYPTDIDKQMLAKQTGLSRNQVSNWFINARVRLWKPMVEEIHSLEVRQLHTGASVDKDRSTDKQAQLPSASRATSSNKPPPQNTIMQENSSSKLPHDELAQVSNHIEEPFNFVYDDLCSHHHVGVGGSVGVKGNGGVSLTLGLCQNNGVCLAEPLPLNVVSFGLEECNDPYVIGSFEGEDRHYGKDIEGHLVYDFVG